MSAVLQGVIVLLAGSAAVYGLLLCVGSGKAAGGHDSHGGHGGHGHH